MQRPQESPGGAGAVEVVTPDADRSSDHPDQVVAMGYSEYARRGCFELVWVAGLTLPLLLWAHWLIREARVAALPPMTV